VSVFRKAYCTEGVITKDRVFSSGQKYWEDSSLYHRLGAENAKSEKITILNKVHFFLEFWCLSLAMNFLIQKLKSCVCSPAGLMNLAFLTTQ